MESARRVPRNISLLTDVDDPFADRANARGRRPPSSLPVAAVDAGPGARVGGRLERRHDTIRRRVAGVALGRCGRTHRMRLLRPARIQRNQTCSLRRRPHRCNACDCCIRDMAAPNTGKRCTNCDHHDGRRRGHSTHISAFARSPRHHANRATNRSAPLAGRPIVSMGWHRGIYEFAVRLSQPLQAIDSRPELGAWAAPHPDGEVVGCYEPRIASRRSRYSGSFCAVAKCRLSA